MWLLRTFCIDALCSCFSFETEEAIPEAASSGLQNYSGATDGYERARVCIPPAFLQQSLQALASPDEHHEAAEPQTMSGVIIADSDKCEQIIVVLGAPTPAGAPVAASLQNRIDKAAALSRKYPDARIICSGGAVATAAVENPAVEAEVMRAGLQALGVNAEQIVSEPLAQTTKGNAEETLKLLAQLPLRGSCRLMLVVEPCQAIRAMRAFLQAKNKYEFSRRCTIALAPVDRLSAAQSSVANPTAEMPRKWQYGGWKQTMDKVCSADSRQDFERQLNEQLKLLWGY
jgi:hypothetical protein